jgi:hypothetical protein
MDRVLVGKDVELEIREYGHIVVFRPALILEVHFIQLGQLIGSRVIRFVGDSSKQ